MKSERIRTFESVSIYDESGEEKELRCPKCGCPWLEFPAEAAEFTDGWMYFGKRVTCRECRHEFTVTENCWEIVCECD